MASVHMVQAAEHVAAIKTYLDGTLSIEQLSTRVWRSQTDVTKQTFAVATMCAELGSRIMFVDGAISEEMKTAAKRSGNVKRFFNKRFHDAGFTGRRFVAFDTVSSDWQSGTSKHGWAHIHYHAIFEVPLGKTRAYAKSKAKAIFGKNADKLGQRQIHTQKPDWTKSYSHNGIKAHGPLGKMFYALKNMGATHNDIELNEGTRRKVPKTRGLLNKKGKGLARAIPSNFNKGAVLCDTVSKQAAEESFYLWLSAERNCLAGSQGLLKQHKRKLVKIDVVKRRNAA